MNRTLLALWAIIFGFILAIVALVVVSTYQREAQARLDLAGLLRRELDAHNRQVRERFEEYDRKLQQAFEEFDPQNSAAVLALERHPLCSMLIIVSADGLKGMLQHPEPDQLSMFDRSLLEDAVNWIRDSNFAVRIATSNSIAQVAQTDNSLDQSQLAQPQPQPPERQFNGRSTILWNKRSTLSSTPTGDAQSNDDTTTLSSEPVSNTANLQVSQNGLPTGEAQWTTWYHGRGLVLGYWVKSLHNTVTMVIVPRGRWLADIVAALPDNSEANAKSLTQLVDVEGTVITQWGNLDLCGSDVIDSELPVEDPLDGWRLRMILTPEARAAALGLDNRLWRGLVAGGFSLALVLLGGLITVNIQRQLRIAQQQVSFVNQVSHELRTPLTNIRMYTELAMQGLELHREHGIDGELDRLTVIQQETTRLGRLIENVLSFARSGKPRPLRACLVENAEQLIDSVLETFAPQLSECGLAVERKSGKVHALHIDQEAVEQILVNLISNAIKYAASGGLLRIETAYTPSQLTVKVTDAGPGIPKRLRSRIFEPFVRGSNRLEAPAGTGIGLTIARQLAREHGGDCRLLNTASGCAFEVTVQSAG